MIPGILMNVGAVAGFCGVVWLMWDKYSTAPMWLLGSALVFLIVGALLS